MESNKTVRDVLTMQFSIRKQLSPKRFKRHVTWNKYTYLELCVTYLDLR